MKGNLGLTEHLHVTGPIVYGFLRLPAPNPARRNALTWALSHYCDQHELSLAAVFTDVADLSAPDAVCTPGFVGLLDAIAAQPGYGVLMPAPTHVGGPDVRERRSGLLKAAGLRLMFCRTGSEPLPAGAEGSLRPVVEPLGP
jgi:hypothetical protein